MIYGKVLIWVGVDGHNRPNKFKEFIRNLNNRSEEIFTTSITAVPLESTTTNTIEQHVGSTLGRTLLFNSDTNPQFVY